jgi:ribosome biogenesis GTPase
MSKKPTKKKLRTELKKNRGTRSRPTDLTRRFQQEDLNEDETVHDERISGKGELTRKRTVVGTEAEGDDAGLAVQLDVDLDECLPGRVLSVHGLVNNVQIDDGRIFRCATRRLLKTLSTDQRHVVAAGDHVLLRPSGELAGIIERVEPRHGVLSRTSRLRQHVIVSNVDQLLIVASAVEPEIKPHLIDRMLISAEKARIRPIVCINKVDLTNMADLQPLAGSYGQLGYKVLFISAVTGLGIDQLRRQVAGQQSVVAGQSGVGKSSLLNAIQPGLELRVRTVSTDNEKGRHTTTTAVLIPLDTGGYIVDTPGIRQFQLWDVIREEVAGYFRDVRPYVSHCHFPDCTHTHEQACAVKDAVADGRIDTRRYESYCQLVTGDTVFV